MESRCYQLSDETTYKSLALFVWKRQSFKKKFNFKEWKKWVKTGHFSHHGIKHFHRVKLFHGVKLFQRWSENSSDLNPIKNVWLQMKMQRYEYTTSIVGLKKSLEKAGRILRLSDAKRNHTKY